MKKLLTFILVAGVALELLACAAVTKKGTLCKRAPSPGSQYCWQHGGTTKAQRAAGMTDADVARMRCKAITKTGSQCKRQAESGKDFCWQHAGAQKSIALPEQSADRQDVKGGESKESTPEKIKSDDRVQCDALTKKGIRCSRKAQPGSTKCWQHQ